MPTSADQIADVSRTEFTRLVKLYQLPEFVKQAEIGPIFEPRERRSNIYADPVRRQFPCDSAASTWVSALYFFDKRAEFHPKEQQRIQHRLDHYVDFWQIRPAYETLEKRCNELHKTADEQLPDSAYAWVFTDDDTGRRERRLRLTNTAEVKAAADWVATHRDRMPFEVRHTIAKRIKEAQYKFGAGLGKNAELVERQAGRGVCQPKEVVQMLRRRADLYKDAIDKQEMVKLAAAVSSSPKTALQPSALATLAGIVDMYDRKHDLVSKYSDFIQRPEDVLFSATFEKVAADLHEHAATSTGSVYSREQLAKLALDDLQALFGSEFSERVRTGLTVDPAKMAEELHTLPYTDARMLDGLLSEAGVSPIMKKSARVGLSHAQLQALARADR